MIKVENIDVWGFEHAVRASRNPMNSWNKSDSFTRRNYTNMKQDFFIGENDINLAKKLYKAGVPHRTYLRMINVWMDVTAPLYLWKELDRYTIGKAQVSTSTMHKIHAKEFTLDDFSHEHLFGDFEPIKRVSASDPGSYAIELESTSVKLKSDTMMMCLIELLNFYREKYLETKDKAYWWQLIQLLPSSYNQKRTIMMSYEVVVKIIDERSGHRLDEWNDFVEILKNLPYVKEITE